MGFSLILSLLMPAVSLPHRPGLLTVPLQPNVERSPTDAMHPAASVTNLAPSIFGAKVLDQ